MARYSVIARMTVDIARKISADSLEDAARIAKDLKVTHFVAPAKGADQEFNDYRELDVYGIYSAD